MSDSFSTLQRRVLLGIVIAYSAAYLNRLNLSAGLGSLMDAFGVSAAAAGLLQTAFAIIYAAGQFINGAIVDRISPVRHILTGIVGTGICNLLMGFAGSYPVFMVLCMLNGAFQSMLWTPIVCLVALCFHTDSERGRANFVCSFTIVFGHLSAWAISGALIEAVGWRLSFIVPAVLMIPVLLAVLFLLRDIRGAGTGRVQQESAEDTPAPARVPALKAFMQTGFGFILIACVLSGFVRDGIVTWTPEILRGYMRGSSLSSTAFSLIIPCVNALGILAGYWLRRNTRNTRKMVSYMLFICTGFCLLLPVGRGILSCSLLMGFACACQFGINPMLTTLIPLEYDRLGRTGLAAGLIDSFIYIGSALAGVIDGGIYEASGSGMLFFTWAGSALLSAVVIYLAGTRRPMRAMEQLATAGSGKGEAE
ncbi:MAG: MFS transporter [Provencibacterium sp.]|jgi:OPA family glycerol-3-phosphate transporter-like MFS transporter|nr:MFS transporter [Provencibacterium sp.]